MHCSTVAPFSQLYPAPSSSAREERCDDDRASKEQAKKVIFTKTLREQRVQQCVVLVSEKVREERERESDENISEW